MHARMRHRTHERMHAVTLKHSLTTRHSSHVPDCADKDDHDTGKAFELQSGHDIKNQHNPRLPMGTLPQALQQLGVRINSVAKLAATMKAAVEELEPAASASASSMGTSTCTPITLPMGVWKPDRWQLAAPRKKKPAAWEVGF